MSDPYTNEHVIGLYTVLLTGLGPGAYAQGWTRRAVQEARFRVMAGVGDLEGTSVLDAGCGLADFYAYLEREGTSVQYSGIDLTPAMLAAAKERYPELD